MWHSAKQDLRDMFVSGIHSRHSFLEFQESTPYSYQKLELPESGSTLHQPKWWHHAHPFVAAAEKHCVMQRSRVVIELWSPRFLTMQWLCCQWCYVTVANQRTIVEIELLATVSWKWGCRPFSSRCSQNVMHWRKEICSTFLSLEFIEIKASTPHQKLEVPESGSTLHQLCIVFASSPTLRCI